MQGISPVSSHVPPGALSTLVRSPRSGSPLSGRVSYPPLADDIQQGHIARIAPKYLDQVRCTLAAFNSFKGRQVTYVSCPVTSGDRLYKFMDEHGFTSLKEAKLHSQYPIEVVGLNIADAEVFTDDLSTREVVIAPTSFEKGFHALDRSDPLLWGQPEFMSMWRSVIENKATKLLLMDGWEKSNGSSEEYLIAVMMQMGFTKRNQITIVDQQNKPLSLDKGLSCLVGAFADLTKRKLNSDSLGKVINALLEAERLHRSTPHPKASLPDYNQEAIQNSAQAFSSLKEDSLL